MRFLTSALTLLLLLQKTLNKLEIIIQMLIASSRIWTDASRCTLIHPVIRMYPRGKPIMTIKFNWRLNLPTALLPITLTIIRSLSMKTKSQLILKSNFTILLSSLLHLVYTNQRRKMVSVTQHSLLTSKIRTNLKLTPLTLEAEKKFHRDNKFKLKKSSKINKNSKVIMLRDFTNKRMGNNLLQWIRNKIFLKAFMARLIKTRVHSERLIKALLKREIKYMNYLKK